MDRSWPEDIVSQPPDGSVPQDTDWETLLLALERDYPNETTQLEALARSEGGENAFPEDLVERGRQIFGAVCDATADRLCGHPTIARMVNASGPRTGDALTIVPLLLNMLPQQHLKAASIGLAALLIVRMGVRTFCARFGTPPEGS